MQKVTVINVSKPQSNPIPAVIHLDFGGKLAGLMFRRKFCAEDSIILDQLADSKLGSAIHMFFMNFPIAAIWVNSNFIVTDAVEARPWFPAYFPQKPSRYIIETTIEYLEHFIPGNQVAFIYD